MNDDFDLSKIISDAEQQAAQREARERANREAKLRATDEERLRANRRRASEELDARRAQEEREASRQLQLATMPPLRRFLHKNRVLIPVVSIALLSGLVFGITYAAQRWTESQRIANVSDSCDPAQINSIPLASRQQVRLSWIRCPNESAQMIALGAILDNVSGSEAARLLSIGAASPYFSVRALAADDQRLPIDALQILANDENEIVRAKAATQVRLPEDALIALVSDPSANVRLSIAANSSTPNTALLALAMDSSDKVISAILARSDISAELILAVSEESSDFACQQIMLSGLVRPTTEKVDAIQRIVENLSRCDDPKVREELVTILQRWNVSSFKSLSSDPNESVRLAAAASPHAPAEVLAKLAVDESDYVRAEVAANNYTPSQLRVLLAADSSEFVRNTAMDNMPFPSLYNFCITTVDEISATDAKVALRLRFGAEAQQDCSRERREIGL